MDLNSNKNDVVHVRQLKALHDAIECITSKTLLQDILDAVPVATKMITGSGKVAIVLVSKSEAEDKTGRKTVKHTNPHPSHLLSRDNRWDMAKDMIKTNVPIVVADSGRFIPFESGNDQPIEDIISTTIPLLARGKTIGFISLAPADNRTFNNIDIILLMILAGHIANAIENRRLDEKMHEVVRHEERNRIAKEILAVVMSDSMVSKTIQPISPASNDQKLTTKEIQVLMLMSKGYTNEEIARELWIGLKTVKTHVSNILKKLGQKNRVQAILYAVRRELIEFDPE